MAASQSHDMYGSSASFMEGELSALSLIEDFADSFVSSLIEHIDQAVNNASMDLQSAAKQDPEWSPYSSLLSVTNESGVLHYGHRGNYDDDMSIASLEFGGPQSPPNPILRTFAEENKQDIADYISTQISMEASFV